MIFPDISGKKVKISERQKSMSLQHTVTTRILKCYAEGFKEGCQPETNLLKDENGHLIPQHFQDMQKLLLLAT
jgi:hypothetical protein